MTPERQEQIDVLYRASLAQEPGERASFLSEACRGDSSLHRAVEQRLAREASRREEEAPESFTATERFQLIRRLGAGGMGVVWEALDLEHKARIALKTFPQNKPGLLMYVKQEFRSLTEIRHPNLVAFYELISSGDQCFFTMEYVDGVDIATYVRSGSAPPAGVTEATETATMPAEFHAGEARHRHAAGLTRADQWERLSGVLPQLLLGIAALHRAGKLHRDIKPGNVLVTRAGRVLLLDFGLAVDTRLPGRGETRVQGTTGYIAPELFHGAMPAPASDLFAVGVLLCQIITGRRPGQGRDTAGATGSFWSSEELLNSARGPAAKAELIEICKRLLDPSPGARPGAEAILRSLGVRVDEPRITDTPALVGREEHLRTLHAALDGGEGEQPSIVFVSGESGVGKSELCRHFLDEVTQRPGTVILAGRCFEQESVPYKALDSMIDSLCHYLSALPAAEAAALMPRDVAALARVFPLLRTLGVVAEAPARGLETLSGRDLRRRAGGALRELLARLADRKKLVVYIDDLQWGDEDSAAVLLDVLLHPEAPPLLLLASHRSEYERSNACLQRLLDGLGPRAQRLAVGPLALADAEALAGQILGPEAPPALAASLARESGGNTYLLIELANGSRYAYGEDRPAGASLDALLDRRTSRLPSASRRLLELVAVSDRPLPLATAFRAAQTERDPDTLSLLRAGRLVRTATLNDAEQIQVYHDRIRETILVNLAPDVLQGHHASLARALESLPGVDPETLAVHLDGAGEGEKAGSYFQLAADRAAGALAFGHAASLYERALRLKQLRGAERSVLQRRRADALANAGRGVEAARIYVQAAKEAAPEEAHLLERQAAYQFSISGHVQEGLDAFRTVLQHSNLHLPRNGRAAAWTFAWTRTQLVLRGVQFRERAEADLSVAERARIDSAWAAGTGLGMVDPLSAACFTAKSLLLALQAGEPYRVARSLAWEGATSSYFGEAGRRRAERLFDACEGLTRRFPNPHARGLLSMARGICAYSAGRWRQARTFLTEAEAVLAGDCTGVAWELATTRAFLQFLCLHLGEYTEIEARCPAVLRDAAERGDLYTEVLVGATCQASVHCARDQPERGRALIGGLLQRWSRASLDQPQFGAMLTDWYIGLYMGEAAHVHEDIERRWPEVEAAGLLRGEYNRIMSLWLRANAAIAAAQGASDPARLVQAAQSATAKLRRETLPFARPLASAMASAAAFQQGDRGGGLARLEAAVSEAEASDMLVILHSARYLLGSFRGGEQGRAMAAAAHRWMRDHGIENPARLASSYLAIPGAAVAAAS